MTPGLKTPPASPYPTPERIEALAQAHMERRRQGTARRRYSVTFTKAPAVTAEPVTAEPAERPSLSPPFAAAYHSGELGPRGTSWEGFTTFKRGPTWLLGTNPAASNRYR
jgi:hypothetical protein